MFLILLAVVILATGIGSTPIQALDVIEAVWRGLKAELATASDKIIWQIRLPRVLLALMVGSSLALAGAVFQGIFQNPLADPYLLGVASGAAFGAAFALVFPFNLGPLSLPLSAFIFALLSVFVAGMIARQGQSLPIMSLILAGSVLSSIFTAASSFLMLYDEARTASILAWLMGSFRFASWSKLAILLPFYLLGLISFLLASKALDLLQLGEEEALQLGLQVERFKLLMIILASLLTAAAVSVSGIIGFVGLIVPHAIRLALGPKHGNLLPLAALIGAIFMILADLLARTVIAPAEIPIGVITALIGGPFFLALLRQYQRR
ncbi:MAG: iron ABC transporter permease [Deinococcales bacterium]